MNKFFLSSLTKAINTFLRLDPESEQRLQKLRGKVISIELLPFHFVFQCVFTGDNSVIIQTDDILAAETSICGTPLQMMGVMLIKDNRQRFFAEDLIIEGNAELGQHVVELFDELQIDWEEHLSRVVGDVPAYHAGRFLRGVREWLGQTDKNFSQNVSEFVHEEAEWFPAREALNDFFSDIDTLRMDVDRAEARINSLSKTFMDNEEAQ